MIGLWCTKSDHITSKILSNIRFTLVVGIITLVCLIPSLVALQKVWGNLTLMLDNLNYSLSICGTVAKLLFLWRKKKVLAVMNDTIRSDWSKMKTDKEINVMRKWSQISRSISIGSTVMISITLGIFFIFPWLGLKIRAITDIEGIDDRFTIQSYYFYNVSKTSYFVFTYCMQMCGMFLAGVSLSGIDSYFALLVFHICGQLQNLNDRIINMKHIQGFKCAIGYCVQEHIRLFRSIELIDNSFTAMLLMVVCYLSIMFCFHATTVLSELNGGNLSFGRTCIIIFAIVFSLGHFCVFCVVGEILVVQCELIYYTIYEYKWYELRPREAKWLIIFLIRASKPAYITAGKLFPMTMTTFCSLLKTSCGYVSVLLANQN